MNWISYARETHKPYLLRNQKLQHNELDQAQLQVRDGRDGQAEQALYVATSLLLSSRGPYERLLVRPAGPNANPGVGTSAAIGKRATSGNLPVMPLRAHRGILYHSGRSS